MFQRQLVPSYLWTGLIVLLYAIPGSELPSFSFWDLLKIDKLMHFGVFMVYTVILITGFRRQAGSNLLFDRAGLFGVIISLSAGAILEGIQGMVFVERVSDLMDFLANAIGAFTGVVIFRLLYGQECFKSR